MKAGFIKSELRRVIMRNAMAMVTGILLAVAVGLSGCIVSATPSTDEVSIYANYMMQFEVEHGHFPPTHERNYTWKLDGEMKAYTREPSYVYSAKADGHDHILEVTADYCFGKCTHTWHITTLDPIRDLLNSMVSIPAGSFMMGSNLDPYEQPVHQVTLNSFDIGAYEVNQAQYEAVMGTNPSCFHGGWEDYFNYNYCANRPVEQVGMGDIEEFCARLSYMTGRSFTLPTEAQWEYACRAGTTTLYSFGDFFGLLGNYAWWYTADETHPVGTKLPNNWGLYDMMGNVWEYCLDSWHNNYIGAPTDGSAWEPDEGSIIRGGSWCNNNPWYFRSANRDSSCYPGPMKICIGFRVVANR